MTTCWLNPPRLHLAAVLVIYAALAAAVQVHCADLLTSDGECYLRMARYYANGDLRHAVFGHWSPLGAWMTVPPVAAGMVPRCAFRVMIGLWGALAVVGAWRLAGRLGMRPWLRTGAAACAALMAAQFSVDHRVDLLLAALLLFYLDAAMDERLLRSRRWAFLVGALGGLAYLAKLYALPFFAAHFTFTILARAWAEKGGRQAARGRRQQERETPARQDSSTDFRDAHRSQNSPMGLEAQVAAPICLNLCQSVDAEGPPPQRLAPLRAWLLGIAGFALVAAPWVAALSGKYGRLTFGTAAGTSYELVGPGSGGARWQVITGLHRPPADAYNVWQDATREPPRPAEGAAPPAGGGRALAEPIRVAGRNAVRILGHVARLDQLCFGLAALGLLPLALAWSWREREAAFRYAAVLLAILVFCGGYAFIQAENERYFWFVFFVLTAAAFHFVGVVPGVLGRLVGGERERVLLTAAMGALAAVSFGWGPTRSVAALLGQPPRGRQHRLVAERLRAMGVAGPLAATNRWTAEDEERRGAWWDGLHTAYYLDAQYAGMPRAKDPAGIVREMREAGAATLLVWGDSQMAGSLQGTPGLELAERIRADSVAGPRQDVVVFRLARDGAPHGSR